MVLFFIDILQYNIQIELLVYLYLRPFSGILTNILLLTRKFENSYVNRNKAKENDKDKINILKLSRN